MASLHVVGIGNASLDVCFGTHALMDGAGKRLADRHALSGGGVAANGTVAAARLGVRASFIGRVGDDSFGEMILDDLAAHDVCIDAVRVISGVRSAIASVVVAADGDRQVVSYRDHALLGDANGIDLAAIDSATCVLADLRWPSGLGAALERARSAGVPVLVDFDSSPDEGVEIALALASHIVFSAHALATFSATDDPAAGLRAASHRTAAFLGVTTGPDGAWWLDGDEARHQPAYPVTACDTTGAGDVFHGALAVAISQGRAMPDAFRFAQGAAALKCRGEGVRASMPGREDVEAFLASAVG